MEVDRSSPRRQESANVSLSQFDISVRARNVCDGMDCHTIGQLSDTLAHKGAEFVLGRPNCGRKTLAELLDLVEAFRKRCPSFTTAAATDDQSHVFLRPEANAERALASLEALQIPFGFPIEFVRLPVRIHNWCDQNNWETLGEFVRNASAMSFEELTHVGNIGRKSANQVVELLRTLTTHEYATIRKFLPIPPEGTALSVAEALHDLIATLNPRDLRLLEIRLIEEATLEATARIVGRTRERVRQVQDRFLGKLDRLLAGFSEDRIRLWQAWELAGDLVPSLTEKGITQSSSLLAAGVSTVFQESTEGAFLYEHWEATFKLWARDLMDDKSISGGYTDLGAFATERDSPRLASRFQSWLGKHFSQTVAFDGQRMTRVGRLTAAQRALLYGGEILEIRWRELFARLKQYHLTYGHADVPHGWRDDPQLAAWVSNQRDRHKKGILSEAEFAMLNDLGLTWKSRDVGTWEDRLAEVVAFKAKHGHCEIPTVLRENRKLGRFVNAMRSDRNRGTLSADRIAKLDAIGFVWASRKRSDIKLGDQVVSEAWKTRFDGLMSYKEAHGDCDVPTRWKANQKLANWVSMQRQMKQRGAMPEARVILLDEMGFNWGASSERQPWQVRYQELMRFQELHGHCNVPRNYSHSPSLRAWVMNQRTSRRLGKLTDEQSSLLEKVGFHREKRPRVL